ncbi:hypothetical protein [Endozoicomonas elysicola]|nr:hypothetical protein [Endozoicomonas elysicola]
MPIILSIADDNNETKFHKVKFSTMDPAKASIRVHSGNMSLPEVPQNHYPRPRWQGYEMECTPPLCTEVKDIFKNVDEWRASPPEREKTCSKPGTLQRASILPTQHTTEYIRTNPEDNLSARSSALPGIMDQLTISEVDSQNSAVVSASAETTTTGAYEQPSHTAIISLLEKLKGEEITAQLEYISKSFDSGFASFCPEATPYCIQVVFQCALRQRGMHFKTIRDEYIIRGKLDFNDDKMKQYVRSMPAENFLNERLQRDLKNPLQIDKVCARVIKKSDNNVNLVTKLDLTSQQKYVYDTIHSLYNKSLNAKVVYLHQTPSSQKPIFGDACIQLRGGQYLFIRFKIPPERVTPEILRCLQNPHAQIQGKLNYNYEWLISKITAGLPLLYSSWPGRPPRENQIFFAPSSISVSTPIHPMAQVQRP